MNAFSQRDPRWASEKLGRSALTLGEAGCLITAVASILADWGVAADQGRPIDPARLNAWLVEHHGYADGSRFIFRAVEPLGVQLRAWVDYYRIPANLARIGKALAAGWGALALVDARPGCDVQAHWVRLLEVGGVSPKADSGSLKADSGATVRSVRRDCTIMDPWQLPGHEIGSLIARYGCKGWDAGRAIFVYVGYARPDGLRRRVSVPAVEQPEVCWRAM